MENLLNDFDGKALFMIEQIKKDKNFLNLLTSEEKEMLIEFNEKQIKQKKILLNKFN